MGRGIALVFAYAGHHVTLIDFKPRASEAFDQLAAAAHAEISSTLTSLARLGLFEQTVVDVIAHRVTVVPDGQAGDALAGADVIFEGVPEVPELKRAALARASALAGPQPIIASTTSTILADDLAEEIGRAHV
jgi:3-hydroxybutyryl-CoA dehydrogenase